MKSATIDVPTLQAGERMSREEFMTRWEAMPELKHAELIGGIVFLKHPVSDEHGDVHFPLTTWLGIYEASTPGCRGNINSTWYMRDDAPQPEISLRIDPQYGGRVTRLQRGNKFYLVGAPELAAEVCLSSRDYDLNEKKELNRKAGVREYICVVPEANKVFWFILRGREYVKLKPKAGILRSETFPGLWLDAKALLERNRARLIEVLRDGLSSPAHAAFVAELAARMK